MERWRDGEMETWRHKGPLHSVSPSLCLSVFHSSELTMPSHNTAVLAGGCFWCTEAAFEQLAGRAGRNQRLHRRLARNSQLPRRLRRRHGPCRSDPHHLRSRQKSATTSCSMSSSTPTIRPSSTARATTSARNIARPFSMPATNEKAGRREQDQSPQRETRLRRGRSSPRSSRSASSIRPRTITRTTPASIPISLTFKRSQSQRSARSAKSTQD